MTRLFAKISSFPIPTGPSPVPTSPRSALIDRPHRSAHVDVRTLFSLCVANTVNKSPMNKFGWKQSANSATKINTAPPPTYGAIRTVFGNLQDRRHDACIATKFFPESVMNLPLPPSHQSQIKRPWGGIINNNQSGGKDNPKALQWLAFSLWPVCTQSGICN